MLSGFVGASQSFAVFPTVVKMIARISSRVLVGLPLCKFSSRFSSSGFVLESYSYHFRSKSRV